MKLSKLASLLFIFTLICNYSFAQNGNSWLPVSTPYNPLQAVKNLNDTLYGYVVQGNKWQIKKLENEVWKGMKPIHLNQETPGDIIIYKGKLIAITSKRLLQYNYGVWTDLIALNGLAQMQVYNGRLIYNGNFLFINGASAYGMGWYDGKNLGVLLDSAGNPAGITGTIKEMLVYNNKLYMCGYIYNTQLGTNHSNIAVWNDTTWSEGFSSFPNPKPAITDMLVWNNDLYFTTFVENKNIGVYKLNGLLPMAMDSVDIGLDTMLTANRSIKSNLTVYNNKLHLAVEIHGKFYIPNPPWPPYINNWTGFSIIEYNGLFWSSTRDTLSNYSIKPYVGTSYFGNKKYKLVSHKNRLYANKVRGNDPRALVFVTDSNLRAATLSIADLRGNACRLDSSRALLGGMVEVDIYGTKSYQYANKYGNANILLPINQVATLTLKDKQLPYYQPKTTCSDSTITLLHKFSKIGSIVFYQEPKTAAYDIATKVTGATGKLCRQGFNQRYYLDVKNVGTETANNVSVKFIHPPNTSYVSSSVTPQTNQNNIIEFILGTMLAGEEKQIWVTINNSTNLILGDTIGYISTANLSPQTDVNLSNNSEYLKQIVVAAHDPNSKQVNIEKVKSWGEDLDYQINFQNLGTDTAFNIVVVDTLPPELLFGTFELVSSSHKVYATLRNNLLTFYFTNILLPDSATNPDGSQGYVRFSIATKSNLSVSDIIKNRGHIFFDFQPAVITNYATTRFYENIVGIKENKLLSFSVSPNPGNGIFKINSKQQQTISIYNQQGVLVFTTDVELGISTINVSNLANGVYSIINQKGGYEKLVIAR